ncbi:MAG: YdcF family protein [Parvularculaceae bacterium]
MRLTIILLCLICAGWATGLLVFIGVLPTASDEPPAPAEGVVVFTGAGARITAGLELLNSGAGARLLISGVNPEITRERIKNLWPGEASLFECCVDLGHQARSTEGNAAEVRAWADAHGFKHLILVTSDYHMPRALLETRANLAGVEISAYPVASGLLDEKGRPASADAWRMFAIEYSKFLTVCIKTLFAPRSH